MAFKEVGYASTYEIRDCYVASNSALNIFIDGTLVISAGTVFQENTLRILNVCWRRLGPHRCWGHLK